MGLPFTQEQFLQVFRDYHAALFPAPFILEAAGIACIVILLLSLNGKNRILSGFLGFLWLWMGCAYHLAFFSSINKAAYLFGALFVLQGLVFVHDSFKGQRFQYSFTASMRGITGLLFMIYALVIYPFTNFLSGHIYPSSPSFGLPCPTTIFTMGLFLCMKGTTRWFYWIIPLLWTVAGFSAAWQLGMKEDVALPISALLFLLSYRQKKTMLNASVPVSGRKTS